MPSARARLGCDEGMEPDMFSEHCSIPTPLYQAIGWTYLVLTPFVVLSMLFVHLASTPSFWAYDSEKKAILMLKLLFHITWGYAASTVGWNRDWDDSAWDIRWSLLTGCIALAYQLLASHRSIRKSVQFVFALRPNVNAVVKKLQGAEAVHLVLVSVLDFACSLRFTGTRTDRARLIMPVIGIGTWVLPLLLLQQPLRRFASIALEQLPESARGTQISQKLERFKKRMRREGIQLAIFAVAPFLIVAVLLRYMLAVFFVVIIFAMVIPDTLEQLGKLNKLFFRDSSMPKGGRSKKIQVVPGLTGASRSLEQWEEDGKCADPRANMPAELSGVEVLGVSLAFLRRLAEEKDVPHEWQMSTICSKVVKPTTGFEYHDNSGGGGGGGGGSGSSMSNSSIVTPRAKKVHCSYAVLLASAGAKDEHGRPFVGKATAMVSYAWGYSFGIVYSALRAQEERRQGSGSGDEYYFIDQFCLDQHVMVSSGVLSKDVMQQTIVDELQKSITHPGVLLSILHPYNAPVVLTRAWCLFEFFTALCDGSEVRMCFAEKDERSFFAALQAGTFDAKAVCASVDAMQAAATEERDREMILQRITKDIGLKEYNERLRDYLVEQFNLVALMGVGGLGSSSGSSRTRGGQMAGQGGVDSRGGSGRRSSHGVPMHGEQHDELLKHMRRMQREQQQLREEVHAELRALRTQQEQGFAQLSAALTGATGIAVPPRALGPQERLMQI